MTDQDVRAPKPGAAHDKVREGGLVGAGGAGAALARAQHALQQRGGHGAPGRHGLLGVLAQLALQRLPHAPPLGAHVRGRGRDLEARRQPRQDVAVAQVVW